MRITIGDRTKKFMGILEIESYPFTGDELKLKYRDKILEHHPDKGGNEEEAKRINEAYKELQPIALNISEEKCAVVNLQHIKDKEDIFKSLYWSKCVKCNGTKNIVKKEFVYPKGFHLLLRPKIVFRVYKCHYCNGVGEIKNEPFNPVIMEGAVLR